MAVLIQIGELNITPFIVLGTYAVSMQPEFDTWYDGNRTERRGIKRTKLKGTFSVQFFSLKDYNDFFDDIETNKTTGDYLTAAKVYDNKSRTEFENVDVYMDYEPTNQAPAVGHDFSEPIEITLTAR